MENHDGRPRPHSLVFKNTMKSPDASQMSSTTQTLATQTPGDESGSGSMPTSLEPKISTSSITRVPVNSRQERRFQEINMKELDDLYETDPRTPRSGRPLLSFAGYQDGESPGLAHGRHGSTSSITSNSLTDTPRLTPQSRSVSFQQPETFAGNESTTTLTPGTTANSPPTPVCPSKHDIWLHSRSWLPIWVLILSSYSTVMSALWLVAAIVQPRWGRAIHSGGSFTPSTASLVTALIAKTIELSFVTVFVTFIGQVLSRRSLAKVSKGVTLAEMSMRTWIIQPGALLLHGQTLRYAGWTILGIISLIACLSGMLYTTASDAMVSPKLKFDDWENVVMEGLVTMSYGNSIAIKKNCLTPISADEDSNSGETCISIEHAANSYHNYNAWLATWAEINSNGTSQIQSIVDRPKGIALLYDNTTIYGNWIEAINMTTASDVYDRVINNVTLAFPHAGIYAAARVASNNIQQPGDLQGDGEYHIRASVPSPALNVICANANATELAPLIYVDWLNSNKTNTTGVPGQWLPIAYWDNPDNLSPVNSSLPEGWNTAPNLNTTVLDDVFGWGMDQPTPRRTPTFPNLPLDYNTVVSSGNALGYGDSMYILTKSAATADYTICSMRSFLSANCSTHYNVSGTGSGSLEAYCEDPSGQNTYKLSQPDYREPYSSDWTDVALQAALALSLNDGTLNANASNARLLSEFVVTTPALNELLPSLAEALAVLMGCTLVMSSTGAPFVHYWEYQTPALDPGTYGSFNASVQSQEYTSGYVQNWQASFYIVLILVFAINAFCLVYFCLCRGLVTDFTEPQNLFAIAVNSPGSSALQGSCGTGPEGRDLGIPWRVTMSDEGHYSIGEKSYTTSSAYREKKRRAKGGIGLGIFDKRGARGGVRHANSYEMLSNKSRSWL